MAKGLPQTARDNIEKCRAATIAAVDVYNRPGSRFRTAHYIVLIVLAWTALFHAMFYRKRIKPWYKKKGKHPKGDRYVHIDGEPKHWDLNECLKQHYGANNAVERKNLEFLIGLRNKIEHRHLPDLDAGLYGECQAALLNLEQMMTAEFGARYAMADQLAAQLQIFAATEERLMLESPTFSGNWEVQCSPFPGGGSTGGCFPGPGSFPLPEPGTLALLGIALAGFGLTLRKRTLSPNA